MPDVPVTAIQTNFRSTLLSWVLKLLVSMALLGFLFRQVNLQLFYNSLKSLHTGYLCLAVLAFFPAQLLTAFRWWFILDQLECDQPYRSVLRFSLLGQFSALFLPGQISGDVVRTFGMAKEGKYAQRIVLSVVLDKLSLLIPITAIASLGRILESPLSPFVGVYLASLGMLIVSLAGIVVLGRMRSIKLDQLIKKWKEHWPSSIRNKISSFFEQNLPTLSYQALGVSILLGFCLQLINMCGSYVLALSMNIKLPALDWAVIQAAVSIVQVFPVSLGGLGVREGTFVLLLSLYSISASKSVAYSLTGFLITAILIIAGWLTAEAIARKR
jgi:uncharacterized protein (TIRG00374 family)